MGRTRGRATPTGLLPTGPFEENPRVARALDDLRQRALSGGASSIMFLPQRGVQFEAWAFAYQTGLCKEMNITRKPGGGLRGTLVINVSGHAVGGPVDRLVGYAQDVLQQRGAPHLWDARSLLSLRNACEGVHRAFAADYQRTQRGLIIEVEPMGRLDMTRTRYDVLQGAHKESPEAARGNRALLDRFAASNTYNVRVLLPDGTCHERGDVPRNQPEQLEYSTALQLELPDVVGTLVLQAWPTGSAEVASYREAREYAIHVGQGFFRPERQMELADSYQRAHDEIRWGSDAESEDLAAHGVSPSPVPYQDF